MAEPQNICVYLNNCDDKAPQKKEDYSLGLGITVWDLVFVLAALPYILIPSVLILLYFGYKKAAKVLMVILALYGIMMLYIHFKMKADAESS